MIRYRCHCVTGNVAGAGKTTTISMLTGMTFPTAGDATVYGKSIVADMPGVRCVDQQDHLPCKRTGKRDRSLLLV